MRDDEKKVKITWDDLDKAEDNNPISMQPPENSSWGTISDSPLPVAEETISGGSIFLKSWFYLGAAGLLGAFLAWAICEPSFRDEFNRYGWGNIWLFPLMAILMCVNLGIAESLIERSWKRALSRGLAASGLGFIFGYVFYIIGNIIFTLLLNLLIAFDASTKGIESNPVLWFSRAIAWTAFGLAGGIIFGIVSKSGKKTSYGILGGIIGAFVGGFLFDPIALITNGGEVSRAIGMSILGASTGVAIGLVENALKDRWLYVSSGPLAGKQFVLYQDLVTIGKAQSCMIFLFKDPSILEHHATIEYRGGISVLTAFGPVEISGQTFQGQAQRKLNSGDAIQIGRYTFSYSEKERSSNIS